MARIVVCGYMVRYPLAGNLFAFFHYVLGLRRLGHEVLYFEESGWPDSCYDPVRKDYGSDPSAGLRIVRQLFDEHGADAPVLYMDRASGAVHGIEWEDLKRVLVSTDLLLNIGGVTWLPELRLVPRRALVDLDPLFTQVGRFAKGSLGEYHVHFSYGANIGKPSSTVPTCGIEWRPAVPPVVIDLWSGRGESAGADAPFTTIANWSAYGSVTYQGERYGQKDEEFLRVIDLPRHTPHPIELALATDRRSTGTRLRDAGWRIRDAGEVSGSSVRYMDYIGSSRGEFSVAKHAYVKTRCGWFSDRSVTYLAAGRPVVLQDTGFTDWLPSGPGVLAFSTLEEAAARLEEVSGDYERHRSGARRIAERVFGHGVVLPRLVDAALGGRPRVALREADK
jgi:hypothetical protein